MSGKVRDIRTRVADEIRRAGLEDLAVRLERGRVTLAGTVDSYAKKLAALDAAHRGGAAELTDNVQVRLPGASARTDGELLAAVADALAFDAFVPDRKIRCTVAKGEVTLEGNVDWTSEREDAARVVRHVAGVLGIRNQIRVRRLAAPRRRAVEGQV